MTIQEAIQSGKPFKRAAWTTYISNKCPNNVLPFSVFDILANDWEIKREPMTIWANVYPDGEVRAYPSKAQARFGIAPKGITKKFIEVIED